MWKAQHRHDINDKAWAILDPILPGQRVQWGGIAEDNRRFINGVFWILRTGHRSAIYCPHMGNGARYTSDSVAGEIKGYGKGSWRC